MQLKLAQALLALPLLTGAAPAPIIESTNLPTNDTLIEARQFAGPPCNVNSRNRDLWVEYGKSRWRTVFSASGIDPGTYCQFWKDGTNIQCGWDAGVDGGWWRVDASFDRGPLGDALYWRQLERSRENWRKAYGCTTG
ncbi:hypothetical protein QBC34DRAFT_385006 [Podospora aff. communis PSN243]|uniref:Ecp2 effector protein domain-containing protein n=1 Tax=Podospora aff. communis PSN243 TaxID=3040156 RepID=A0AAV9GBT2_9PEZI|nr:hypothetical protein QBC34DRAFT_385006 [Podospora aff. communis PSN243]